MELIETPEESGDEIKRCIGKFGYAPEHNWTYFLTTAEQGARNLFLKSDDGYGVLTNYRENTGEVVMVSEALAPREKQVEILRDALDLCFSQLKATKFVVEQDDALRTKTVKSFKGNGYAVLQPRFSLYWPVFNMEKWHGDDMTGDDWKKLRNIKNRFYGEHSVEVVDSRTVDKEELK
ncbi:MAG: hypothetical protein AABX60_02115, partial [Nanoarchaeota archaeon]